MKIRHGGLVHVMVSVTKMWRDWSRYEYYTADKPQPLKCGGKVRNFQKVGEGAAVTCMGCVT